MPRLPTSEDDPGLSRAVASRTAHVVHLTHNDLDAVGADAIHRIKFGKAGVFTVWSSVGKFPGLFSLIASCPRQRRSALDIGPRIPPGRRNRGGKGAVEWLGDRVAGSPPLA